MVNFHTAAADKLHAGAKEEENSLGMNITYVVQYKQSSLANFLLSTDNLQTQIISMANETE